MLADYPLYHLRLIPIDRATTLLGGYADKHMINDVQRATADQDPMKTPWHFADYPTI